MNAKILLTVFLLTTTCVSASEITFAKNLSGGISTLIEFSTGGYIGSDIDQQYPTLVRFDEGGNVIEASEYVIQGKSGAHFDHLIETRDRGFAAIGGVNVASFRKPIIATFDATGKPQWQILLGDRDDQLNWIHQTKDGGYVVVGRKSVSSSDSDAWIIKLTSNGTVSWSKTVGSSGYDLFNFVKETSDNGFVVAGTLVDFGGIERRIIITKIDSQGNLIWNRLYSAIGTTSLSVDSAVSIAGDGLVIAGLHGPTWGTVLLMKIGSQGGIVWSKIFESGHHSLAPFSVIRTRDDNFVTAGVSDVYRGPDNRGLLFKVNSEGKLLWSRRTWSWLFSANEDRDGGISLTAQGVNLYGVLKTNAKGLIPSCRLLWRFPLKVKSPKIKVSSIQDLRMNPVSIQPEPLVITLRKISVLGEDACN